MRENITEALLDLLLLPVQESPDAGHEFDRLQRYCFTNWFKSG